MSFWKRKPPLPVEPTFMFKPAPDITAFETARILAGIWKGPIVEGKNRIPDDLKRHFERLSP